MSDAVAATTASAPDLDALIIGAGLTGMHQLYTLKELGWNVRAYEEGAGLGGVWYRNRYPGARFDSEVEIYTYAFSQEILEKWDWKERFSPQPNNLEYLNFSADVMGIRDRIEFNRRVTRAVFNAVVPQWEVHFSDGEVVTTRFLITAVGGMSQPTLPNIKGVGDFEGISFHSANWPHDPDGGPGGQKFDFSDKRVGVLGNGSSGVQIIERLGAQAKEMYVFLRNPQWTEPINNHVLDEKGMQSIRDSYKETFEFCETSFFGYAHQVSMKSIFEASEEEREAFFEELYNHPGMTMWMANYWDATASDEAASIVAEFMKKKIRQRVKDPVIAEKLTPDYGFGYRRVAMETSFYETFNRDSVTLVDLKETPIEEVTANGIRTTEKEYPLDFIVYATGFSGIDGALNSIEFVGTDGQTLKSKWDNRIQTYLGTQIVGFPNLFTLVGPHSGAAPTNLPRGSQMHVEWTTRLLNHVKENNVVLVEPTQAAEDEWTDIVEDAFDQSIMNKVDSWFNGVNRNIPGRDKRIPVVYVGGLPTYRQYCEEVEAEGYRGFEFRALEQSGSSTDLNESARDAT